VMDDVIARGAFLVWIGLPIARDPALTAHFRILNHIYITEAKKRAHKVAYIDTYHLFQTTSGKYSDYLPTASGSVVRMRSGDGVHYEDVGGQQIAQRVIRKLEHVFDLS